MLSRVKHEKKLNDLGAWCLSTMQLRFLKVICVKIVDYDDKVNPCNIYHVSLHCIINQ